MCKSRRLKSIVLRRSILQPYNNRGDRMKRKIFIYKTDKWLLLAILSATFFYVSCDKPTLGPELKGSIAGVVKDYESNQPVANVNITTSPPSSSVVTSSDGKYQLSKIGTGNYTVSATKSGYEANSVTVNVQAGQSTQAVIFLKRKSQGSSIGTYPLDIKVINWANRVVISDSIYVDVQYRVENVSESDISSYSIYFRIPADSVLFEHEESGTDLKASQTTIREFSQYLRGNKADSVKVANSWSSNN